MISRRLHATAFWHHSWKKLKKHPDSGTPSEMATATVSQFQGLEHETLACVQFREVRKLSRFREALPPTLCMVLTTALLAWIFPLECFKGLEARSYPGLTPLDVSVPAPETSTILVEVAFCESVSKSAQELCRNSLVTTHVREAGLQLLPSSENQQPAKMANNRVYRSFQACGIGTWQRPRCWPCPSAWCHRPTTCFLGLLPPRKWRYRGSIISSTASLP